MRKRKHRYNINGIILCGLAIFVIGATAFCKVVDSHEAERREERIEAQKEKEREQAKAAAEKKRAEDSSVQPGVPVGTLEPAADKKIVYLTFDDGPSEYTEQILEILRENDVKGTFFITGAKEKYRHLIKEAYDAGHTIGLHTYSHDYSSVYSSENAYFEDLEKIAGVAEEQLGFVPCFIRFPGGSSNRVSEKYSKGIMTDLAAKVQEEGYQYYDWNVDSGDGANCSKDEIIANSVMDRYQNIMILFHDTKPQTVEALPQIIQSYKDSGYEFRPIDRAGFVSQHKIFN